jgi:capsule polysaccharide export protein KpsE/RkpR
MKLHSHFHKK